MQHFKIIFVTNLRQHICLLEKVAPIKSYEERCNELGLGDPRDKKKHAGHDPGAHAEKCLQGQGSKAGTGTRRADVSNWLLSAQPLCQN
jgi:hypothetical protein